MPTSARSALAVGAAFAVQGLGYAAVVTALPAAKDRFDLTDAVVSAILLGVCLTAALGSGVADVVAVRADSRTALRLGLLVQAAALVAMSVLTLQAAYVVAVLAYGLGIGVVDAASNMQGVDLQARAGRPFMGRLYSAYTVGGIVGALTATGVAALDVSAFVALVAVAVVQAVVAVVVGRHLLGPAPAPAQAAEVGPLAHRPPLDRRAVAAVGALVLVAFVVDAAVSSWSTVYLSDGLGSSDAVAPIGYAAYLAVVLVARLGADPAAARWGRRRVVVAAVGAGVLGCALVAAGDHVAFAVVGLALAGAVAGLMVPIAFSQAGDVEPERSDEVIARVNVFNYAGAVIGAVLPGLSGGGAALRFGFVGPALALLLVVPLVLRLPSRPGSGSRSGLRTA